MDPRLNDMRNKGEYNFGEQDGTRSPNMPGVYFHEGAGKFIETGGIKLPDGRTVHETASGKIQADAFQQMGFRPVTEKEQAAYDAAQSASARVRRISETRTTTVMSSQGRK